MASAVFLLREFLIKYREVRPTDALNHVHHSNDSDARVHRNSFQERLLQVLQLLLIARNLRVDVRDRVLRRPNP